MNNSVGPDQTAPGFFSENSYIIIIIITTGLIHMAVLQ